MMPHHPPENSPFDCAVDAFLIVWGAVHMYRNYRRWDSIITPTSDSDIFGKRYEVTGKTYFWLGFMLAMLGLWGLVFSCGWSPFSIYGPSK